MLVADLRALLQGTCQFQSVRILRNTALRVEVPDELESFFNVFLYHAIRYLPSTLNPEQVGDFLELYFDSFHFDRSTGSYLCGERKAATIIQGSLEFSSGIPIQFINRDGSFHPHLNKLVKEMLKLFRAFYLVHPAHIPSGKSKDKPTSTSVPSDRVRFQNKVAFQPLARWGAGAQADEDEDEDSEDQSSQDGAGKQQAGVVVTRRDRTRAKKLETHGAITMLLVKATRKAWPEDAPRDRISPNWEPKVGVLPPRVALGAGSGTQSRSSKLPRSDTTPDVAHARRSRAGAAA